MNTDNATTQTNWQQQAEQWLQQGNYIEAANCYEQAIALEPDVKSHAWYLGLALLLADQEADAQATWMMSMMEGEPEQIEVWTQELTQILWAEATRRESQHDYDTAWRIRQQLTEITPEGVNNWIILLLLAIELNRYTAANLNKLTELLQGQPWAGVHSDLLVELLHKSLDLVRLGQGTVEFAAACIPYVPSSEIYIGVVLQRSVDVAFVGARPDIACKLAELCLQVDPNNLEVLGYLTSFYINACEYMKGIETAKRFYAQSEAVADRVYANQLILQALVSATGHWEEATDVLKQHEALLLTLADASPNLSELATMRLSTTSFFFPYFRDDLKANRTVHNLAARLFQDSMERNCPEQVARFRQRQITPATTRPLKIGYLSYCLGKHSVGWLARSLFEHHDRDRFELYGYFVNYRQGDPVQEWYASKVSKSHKSTSTALEDILEIAERIHQDEVDVLIDLDSLTMDISCSVVALKPAPVQVSWLGWDASGIPAIDYFIADPYVLPDWADDHYQEKIWRLPQTYIGLDGFEVAVPTLRRDELGLPADAITYLCVQNSYKRHPAISRLQMQIIREVPNSYLLIKGVADESSLKRFFLQLATEEGVDHDRLRFLEGFNTEAMHRASLRLADVVLDTYPYNGATTTLETLWMEVPLVTRVGETFSSRNSYTMMVNAGVSEGIAWTDEEYLQWGIRLGTDPALRQKISWQLRTAKHTAPLWNGKQFTREMEKAYEQMWASRSL